ncbi:nuclear fragile X mental retardation-interacting protein 1-domain-containing protein [Russula emetica]|nr:nuclear fragile X mental retardation-interacting protein 1-domain-containing protein [Russula emetica]
MDPASVARSLTSALANPYSRSIPHTPQHHVNSHGYTYSSAYNPSSYPSISAPSFSNLPSASAGRSLPPRGPPPTHWYTPGNSKCTYSGCTFTGSANSVQTHMMDRHLIYPPGWHTRRRQPDWDADPSLKSKPIPILGTNVRLDTPEEIAAWIAERKRRWPTEARVVEKKRKLEQAMANGELHPDHLALMGGKRFRPLSFDADVTRTKRGRGGASFGFGGSRGRGRGRGRGAYSRNLVHERSAAHNDDDAAPEVMSAKRPPGIVAYGSSSDAELEKPHAVNDQPGPTITSSSRNGPEAVSASQQSSLPKAESANRPRRAPPSQPKMPPRNSFAARPSLLRNLLLPEIRVTVSNLSQAIHFLVENDFLENVELKPGEANEKRIEVLGEHPAEPEAETEHAHQ